MTPPGEGSAPHSHGSRDAPRRGAPRGGTFDQIPLGVCLVRARATHVEDPPPMHPAVAPLAGAKGPADAMTAVDLTLARGVPRWPRVLPLPVRPAGHTGLRLRRDRAQRHLRSGGWALAPGPGAEDLARLRARVQLRVRPARAVRHGGGIDAPGSPRAAHPALGTRRARHGAVPARLADPQGAVGLPGEALAPLPGPVRAVRGAGGRCRVRVRLDALHRARPDQRPGLRRRERGRGTRCRDAHRLLRRSGGAVPRGRARTGPGRRRLQPSSSGTSSASP